MLNALITFFLLASTLFGQDNDPYRWLEEESIDQQKWVAAQAERTEGYFAQCSEREAFQTRLTAIADFEKIGPPEQSGDALYFAKHRKGDNKTVLVRSQNGKEVVLVDPNQFDKEVSLVGFTISPTGNHLAYGLSLAGSDQHVWSILDLKTGHTLPEVLDEIQFAKVSWDTLGTSVFYVRHSAQLYRHTLGTETAEDELLYESPEGHLLFDPEPVMEGRGLLLTERPWSEKNNRIVLLQLFGICTPPYSSYELVPAGDVEVSYVGEGNDELFFITDENCCYGKLISINSHGKREVIPEQEALLLDAVVIGDQVICVYYKNAAANLKVYDLNGNFLKEIPVEGQGTVLLKHSKSSNKLFYSFMDYKTPSTIFSYDPKSGQNTLVFTPKLNFDPADFVTTQKWYASKDGTLIPFFITHRKELAIDEKTPVLLYGYGGFGIAVTPFFRSEFLAWLESGGVLVVPNLRGGKEFGNNWHDQGRIKNKQNVFDDCIAAADYLERNKVGSSKTRAIYGTSNGGLLAGACVTQRPDLFGAAIVNKGVLDMLRFHLHTVGKYWISEYGNPDDPEESAYLLSYSPYHRVEKGGHYPAILINTADHDDRVVPLHSFKFAAALQEAQSGSEPILLRLEEACGHGGSDSCKQEIAFGSDLLTFLFKQIGGA